MLFDSLDSVKEILLSTVLVYFFLIIILRVSGKRSMAELNSFDIVLTMLGGN